MYGIHCDAQYLTLAQILLISQGTPKNNEILALRATLSENTAKLIKQGRLNYYHSTGHFGNRHFWNHKKPHCLVPAIHTSRPHFWQTRNLSIFTLQGQLNSLTDDCSFSFRHLAPTAGRFFFFQQNCSSNYIPLLVRELRWTARLLLRR
jgi:hypothetical protein